MLDPPMRMNNTGGKNAEAVDDERSWVIQPVLNQGIAEVNIPLEKFELMFQMLQFSGQFGGTPNEDPHLNLQSFLDVSNSFKLEGITEDALRLALFPYSLRERAKGWLEAIPPWSITCWNDLAEKFLAKYFPPSKVAKLRREIICFQQWEDESVYETWERFKELLRKCPNHGLPKQIQMQTFYDGLNGETKMVVDMSAGGGLLSKTYNEAYDIVDKIAWNIHQCGTPPINQAERVAQDFNVALADIAAQIATMNDRLRSLTMDSRSSNRQLAGESCVYHAEGHAFDACPSNRDLLIYVEYNENFNPYSNTYNPSWMQHPDLFWDDQGAGSTHLNVWPPVPTSFQEPFHPPQTSQAQSLQVQASMSSIKSLLKEHIDKSNVIIQSQAAALRNLENQVGQLASALNNRAQGTVSSDIENPRNEGEETYKPIQHRSGKELESPESSII